MLGCVRAITSLGWLHMILKVDPMLHLGVSDSQNIVVGIGRKSLSLRRWTGTVGVYKEGFLHFPRALSALP